MMSAKSGMEEIIVEVRKKREFSQLPEKDIEIAVSHFLKRQTSEEEKVRLTRELLHKVFSSFLSSKLLSPKNKAEEWMLRKHLSTRERLKSYKEIYSRIFSHIKEKKVNIIDLGCGINGFSVKMMKEFISVKKYTGVESVGQLVNIANDYFKREKINGIVLHESLFNLENIIQIFDEQEKPRVVFLFKVVNPLEAMENNYSKKLISLISKKAELFVVSFATESMHTRTRFRKQGMWFLSFLEKNYKILDDFEKAGERYMCFREK